MVTILVIFVAAGLLIWSPQPATAQQDDIFDVLPECNYTEAAPDNDIIVGAIIYNFVTGSGCAENLDTAFPVASVPKIFILAAMFDWILENDAITFDIELTFNERYWMGGRSDCLDESMLNQRVSVGTLGDLMIECSDNAATWMLMDAMSWDYVNDYTQSLGIEGIGEIIPYSEVDRQKLTFLNSAWERVPAAMASRFYRAQISTGLNIYFDDIPSYPREEIIRANALYLENTSFNTMTPRAMANYIAQLREQSSHEGNDGQVARWVFNTMRMTDRQFTVQDLPDTFIIGAKNGWDYGIRAEVSVIFDSWRGQSHVPSGMVIVFARQTDFNQPSIEPPYASPNGRLSSYLQSLSPAINDVLFPR